MQPDVVVETSCTRTRRHAGGGKNDIPFSLRQRFIKTKMCRHKLKGRCCRGVECPFAHTESELRSLPTLDKTTFCSDYSQGRCGKAEPDCRYAHCEEELRSTVEFFKTSLCPAYKEGNCMSGAACRYAHGVEEIRPRPYPQSSSTFKLDCNSRRSRFSTATPISTSSSSSSRAQGFFSSSVVGKSQTSAVDDDPVSAATPSEVAAVWPGRPMARTTRGQSAVCSLAAVDDICLSTCSTATGTAVPTPAPTPPCCRKPRDNKVKPHQRSSSSNVQQAQKHKRTPSSRPLCNNNPSDTLADTGSENRGLKIVSISIEDADGDDDDVDTTMWRDDKAGSSQYPVWYHVPHSGAAESEREGVNHWGMTAQQQASTTAAAGPARQEQVSPVQQVVVSESQAPLLPTADAGEGLPCTPGLTQMQQALPYGTSESGDQRTRVDRSRKPPVITGTVYQQEHCVLPIPLPRHLPHPFPFSPFHAAAQQHSSVLLASSASTPPSTPQPSTPQPSVSPDVLTCPASGYAVLGSASLMPGEMCHCCAFWGVQLQKQAKQFCRDAACMLHHHPGGLDHQPTVVSDAGGYLPLHEGSSSTYGVSPLSPIPYSFIPERCHSFSATTATCSLATTPQFSLTFPFLFNTSCRQEPHSVLCSQCSRSSLSSPYCASWRPGLYSSACLSEAFRASSLSPPMFSVLPATSTCRKQDLGMLPLPPVYGMLASCKDESVSKRPLFYELSSQKMSRDWVKLDVQYED